MAELQGFCASGVSPLQNITTHSTESLLERLSAAESELAALREKARWRDVTVELPDSRALVSTYSGGWPERGFWFDGRWYTKASGSTVGGEGYSTGRVVTHWKYFDSLRIGEVRSVPTILAAATDAAYKELMRVVEDVPPDPAVLMDALHGSVHKDEGPECRGRLQLRSTKPPTNQE
jgi:hypothetical protein